MEPYTVAGLARRASEAAESAGGDLSDAASTRLDVPLTPGSSNNESAAGDENPCTKYKLQGVIVHQGLATAGHYYTYIRTRETASQAAEGCGGQWLKFNDDSVTVEEVSPDPICDGEKESENEGRDLMSYMDDDSARRKEWPFVQ